MRQREIELGTNISSLDKGAVTLGSRIDERRKEIGLSQAELARRVGVRQSTMNSLINGDSRSSRSIVAIARELATTPAYLTGEIDDPDAGAPQPSAEPNVQLVTMPVALPSEDGLARAFQGLLAASRGMEEAALARELAKRLPTLLGVLRGPLVVEQPDPAAAEAPADAHREQRRA